MVDNDDYSIDDDFESPIEEKAYNSNSIEPKKTTIPKADQDLLVKDPAFHEKSAHSSVNFKTPFRKKKIATEKILNHSESRPIRPSTDLLE